MSDSLYSGRRFGILNVIDDYGRLVMATQPEFSIPFGRVIRILNEVAEVCGLSKQIVVDNGPEFTSKFFLNEHKIKKSIFILRLRESRRRMLSLKVLTVSKMRNEYLNEN